MVMKSSWGNATTVVTALFILGLLCFIGYTVWHHADIRFWGRRSLFLACYGLLVCCFAAARDGLDKTIQNAICGNCAPGIFPLVSLPNCIGCVGASLILFAGIATLFSKSQHAREIWFYVMSGGAMLKIVTVEIAKRLW